MSYIDPLDSLLAPVTQPQAQPQPVPPQPAVQAALVSPPASQSGGFQWAVVGLLVGVMAVLAWQRYGDGFEFGFRGDQQQEQKQDTKAKGVVFIHERNPLSIEHDLVLREMPKWCEQHGLASGFRSYDDDMTDAPVVKLKDYAASKGVSPPFVALIDLSGNPTKVVPFVDMSSVEKVIK